MGHNMKNLNKIILIFTLLVIFIISCVFLLKFETISKESNNYKVNLFTEDIYQIKLDNETYFFDFDYQASENISICYVNFYPIGYHSTLESYHGKLIINLLKEESQWIISNISFDSEEETPFDMLGLGEQETVVEPYKFDRIIHIDAIEGTYELESIDKKLYQYIIEETVYDNWHGIKLGSCTVSLHIGVKDDCLNFYMNKIYKK